MILKKMRIFTKNIGMLQLFFEGSSFTDIGWSEDRCIDKMTINVNKHYFSPSKLLQKQRNRKLNGKKFQSNFSFTIFCPFTCCAK